MLEQIAALVKQFGQETVVNNPDISNDLNEEVLADATHTISGGMQNMLAGGGLQDIISMFTGGGGGSQTNPAKSGGIGGLLKNPIVMMMVGHFVSKLISKYKMSPEKANNISSTLIPGVLTDLVSRTKDTSPENDSFDLNDLIGSLTGGNVATSETSGGGGFNFQNLINQFTGGGNDSNSGNGGGGFDLQDIISKVTSGAQQNQAQQSGGGGGLFDLIKGFISK